jgi:hypothetical protein
MQGTPRPSAFLEPAEADTNHFCFPRETLASSHGGQGCRSAKVKQELP